MNISSSQGIEVKGYFQKGIDFRQKAVFVIIRVC